MTSGQHWLARVLLRGPASLGTAWSWCTQCPPSHRSPLSMSESSRGPSELLPGTKHSPRHRSTLGRLSGPIHLVSWDPSLPADGDPCHEAEHGIRKPRVSVSGPPVWVMQRCIMALDTLGLPGPPPARLRDGRDTQGLSQTRSRWSWVSEALRALERGSHTQALGSESHMVLLL